MTKYIFLLFTLTSLFSCNSDDSSEMDNNSEIILDFQEPPLNFLINQAQFITENGQPDNIIGATLYYNSDENGEIERIFDFDGNNFSDSYFLNNVHFNSNQNNLDFMLNWLTNKYGEPILEQESPSTQYYIWYNTNTSFEYIVQLVFSTDLEREDALLFASYNYDL